MMEEATQDTSLAATVLVADDEALIALDMRGSLERIGYEVTHVVHSAEDAVAAVVRQPVDLALLDIRMPGAMDGLDAGTELLNKYGIPVIYVTAHSDHATLARAKESAPYGYLVKPLDEQVLKTTIELALYRHQIDSLRDEGASRHRTLFEQDPAARFITSANGAVLECNASFARILGYETPETARYYAVLPSVIADPSSSLMSALETDGIVEGVELDLMGRDGNLVPALASGRILEVKLGRLWEVQWTAIPVG